MKYERKYTILFTSADRMQEGETNMTYKEAREFLDGCARYAGEELALEPLREMLRRLGDPQDRFFAVHIAGTNGKGSTLAFVSSVLEEAGYRTGRYISPTIFEYRERIQVNGQYIPEEDLARLTERIYETGREMLKEGFGHPTTFEAETALAFLYFAEQGCDLAVIECGRGGLTDATNVLKCPGAAVFASISLDHLGVLGGTLGEIAANKAGIIKPGCRVVTYRQEPEAEKEIRKKAKECGCPVYEADPALAVNRVRGLGRQSFDYKEWKGMKISLAGEYQFGNAALALETAEALRMCGCKIPDEAVYRGMEKASWPARFMVIGDKPLFIMDGAHNRDAAQKLLQTVEKTLPGRRIVGIMGMLADKEYGEVVRIMAPCLDTVFTVTPPDNPRALDAEKLADTARRYGLLAAACARIDEAVDKSLGEAGEGDVILAFGSLSYLGELDRCVQKRRQ